MLPAEGWLCGLGDGGVRKGGGVLTIPDIFFDNWKRGLDLEFWNFLNKLEYSIYASAKFNRTNASFEFFILDRFFFLKLIDKI